MTLAEGSGGILHYISHLFPNADLIYNTLQSDTVERKENILNVYPPALMGDTCNLLDRVKGIEETCLGETDITTEVFSLKLTQLLETISKKILIFSMDAELKTDISNMDKMGIYLPLVKPYLAEGGLFINKMFLNDERQIPELKSWCRRQGVRCNVHKPSSSHPHNREVYLVCFSEAAQNLEESEDIIGERHVLQWRLQNDRVQLLSSRVNRVNFLKTMIGQALSPLFAGAAGHECVWAVRTEYSISEVTRYFATKRHQRNLVMCLLSIERDSEVVDYQEKTRVQRPFMKKEVIVALLILSILTRISKNPSQMVSFLDSLSVLEASCNIIPPKKMEVSLNLVTGPEAAGRSVLGILDHKMKDYFRTLPYLGGVKVSEVPSYTLEDGETKMRETEQIRFAMEENMRELIRESECGYTSFLRVLEQEHGPGNV